MIVVYILVSCQLPWEPFLKANTDQRPVETGRKLKANTVQQQPVETGHKLDANRVQRPVETGRRSRLLSSGNLDESYPCKVVTSKIPAFEVALQVIPLTGRTRDKLYPKLEPYCNIYSYFKFLH